MVNINKIVNKDNQSPTKRVLNVIQAFNEHNKKNKKQVYWIDYLLKEEMMDGTIITKVIKKDKKQPIKFLSHYYKCGFDGENQYYQRLLNPLLGENQWYIEHWEENNKSEVRLTIMIKESTFTTEMHKEIMTYVLQLKKVVKEVQIQTYLYVEQLLFTESERKQLIGDAYNTNEYGISIIIN